MAKRKKKKSANAKPADATPVNAKATKAAITPRSSAISQVVPSPPGFFWATLFIIASVALLGPYGQKGGYTPDLHMSAYIQVLSFGLLTIMVFSWYKRRNILFPRAGMIILPIVLLYAWITLSALWVVNRYEFLIDYLYWGGAIVCGLLVLLTVRDMQGIRKFLFGLFISGFLIALFGIGQYLFGIDWVQQHIVPAATFSNKNMAGQYGLLTLPLAMVFFLEAKDRSFWFYAIASALMISFMFYTRSRAVWISGVLMLIVFMLILLYWRYVQGYKMFHSAEKIMAVLVALVVTFAMFSFTPKTFGFSEEVHKASIGSKSGGIYGKESGFAVAKTMTSGAESTASVRGTMWTNSIPMFVDNFFLGTGFGNWIAHYPLYQAWYRQDTKLLDNQYHANAHNDWVEFVTEFGVFGTLIFLWLLVNLFRVVKRVLSDKQESTFSILMLGPAMALLGIGIDAIFSFPLKQPVPIMLVFTYIAIFCCAYCVRRGDAGWKAVNLPPTIYKETGAVILSIITAALLAYQYQLYQSELQYRIAVTSIRSNSPGSAKRALTAAQKAHEYNPMRSRLLWLEGTALLKLNSVDKAIEKLEGTLASYPYSESATHNAATAYVHTGQAGKALYVMNRLREVQPYDERDYHKKLIVTYTNILLRLGLHQDAKEMLELRLATAYSVLEAGKRRYQRALDASEAGEIEDSKLKKAKRILNQQQATVQKFESQIKALDKKIAERQQRFLQPVTVAKSETKAKKNNSQNKQPQVKLTAPKKDE